MKIQTASYTIPAFDGTPLAGHLIYRKERKLTEQIVRQRVAKTYAKQGIKPAHVTNICIAA